MGVLDGRDKRALLFKNPDINLKHFALTKKYWLRRQTIKTSNYDFKADTWIHKALMEKRKLILEGEATE